jgi:hypothetical protein
MTGILGINRLKSKLKWRHYKANMPRFRATTPNMDPYPLRSFIAAHVLIFLTSFSLSGAEPLPAPETIPAFDELRESVEELRIKNITWRSIDWNHSILDGLKASRKEGKPIIFWCHIDLPADDKRC